MCSTSSCCTPGCDAEPTQQVQARTFFFAGKAAPAYRLAKLIIKLINSVAAKLDDDPASQGRLRVVFIPDYNVTLASGSFPQATSPSRFPLRGSRQAALAT